MQEFIWEEKYRPKTIDECILPKSMKEMFKGMVAEGDLPNMTFAGPPGVGKTTVAQALCNELGADCMVVNASLDRNIDMLRETVQPFASSVSFFGKRKYVIFDEADNLNPLSTQPALRNFMNEYSKNCGFILTCNYPNKIIEPLRDSRAPIINFKIPKSLAKEIYDNLVKILEAENVEYEPLVVGNLVKECFPDQRRMINILQRESSKGKIDTGALTTLANQDFEELINLMKTKDFTAVRAWVGKNSDLTDDEVFRNFYEQASKYFSPATIPALVILIAKYQYQSAFVSDKEVNLSGFCAEVMINCELK